MPIGARCALLIGHSERVDERLAANRLNWDERTEIHLDSAFYDVEGWLHRAPGPRTREIDALGDVSGLSLVHLQCHIGLDTLQFARAGARVTGLDFSSAAIDAARDLADCSGLADQSRSRFPGAACKVKALRA
jgi:2-polyprenyl-3-methyl-5-hydroxy-6-metoxy-1,4-benzoquinol methylase